MLYKNLGERNVKARGGEVKKGRKLSDVRQDNTTGDVYALLEKNSSCVFRKLSMGNANFINL